MPFPVAVEDHDDVVALVRQIDLGFIPGFFCGYKSAAFDALVLPPPAGSLPDGDKVPPLAFGRRVRKVKDRALQPESGTAVASRGLPNPPADFARRIILILGVIRRANGHARVGPGQQVGALLGYAINRS